MTVRELLIKRAREKQSEEDALFELEVKTTDCNDCPVLKICDDDYNGLSCFEELKLRENDEVDENGFIIKQEETNNGKH